MKLKPLKELLKNNQIIFVDIGASGGIHSRWKVLAQYYKAILFEPDPDAYNVLKMNNAENFLIINSALSDSNKEIDFFLCKGGDVSSVYHPNYGFLEKYTKFERFQVIKKMKIIADSLNNQLHINNIAEIDFIKIDVQGHELSILKGAGNYLDNVVGIDIEVEFAPLYTQQALFCDVDVYLREKGFELYDISQKYYHRNIKDKKIFGKGQLVWGDAIYFRSPEKIIQMPKLSQNKIIRSFCIYLLYGYTELAYQLINFGLNRGILTQEIYDILYSNIKKFNSPVKFFLTKIKSINILLKLLN